MLIGTAGAALLVVVVADFLFTTIGATYSTQPSHIVARATWRALTAALPDRGWVHAGLGPLVMCAVAAYWVLGTSVAWTMVLQFDARAAVIADGGAPAGWWLDFAFAGHMLSTLGGALAQPGTTGWSVAAVFIAVNGMVILTLAVSFVLSTTQTVTEGRAFLARAEATATVQEAPHRALLGDLTTLVAKLNSAAFALYYSTAAPRRRLPARLPEIFRTARGTEDAAAVRALMIVLEDLPGFRPPERPDDPEAFQAALDRWADRYRFGAADAPG